MYVRNENSSGLQEWDNFPDSPISLETCVYQCIYQFAAGGKIYYQLFTSDEEITVDNNYAIFTNSVSANTYVYESNELATAWVYFTSSWSSTVLYNYGQTDCELRESNFDIINEDTGTVFFALTTPAFHGWDRGRNTKHLNSTWIRENAIYHYKDGKWRRTNV